MMNEDLYKVEVTVKKLPKGCIDCPFYIEGSKGTWICFLSDEEMSLDGS